LYSAPTRRPTIHHRANPYPGARRQNETEIFSDHDETNPSKSYITAYNMLPAMPAVMEINIVKVTGDLHATLTEVHSVSEVESVM